jgi:hypothetical protein
MADDRPPHPLAERSDRRLFVNGLIVVALGAIAWEAWPTDRKKLEKVAREYVATANRRDPARLRQLKEVKVDGGVGTVTTTVQKTGAVETTQWVKVDGAWRPKP